MEGGCNSPVYVCPCNAEADAGFELEGEKEFYYKNTEVTIGDAIRPRMDSGRSNIAYDGKACTSTHNLIIHSEILPIYVCKFKVGASQSPINLLFRFYLRINDTCISHYTFTNTKTVFFGLYVLYPDFGK